MGLLTGSVSCVRFNVIHVPEEPDFEKARFIGIQPGSQVREREGIIPFEPGEPFLIANRKWAFRVRMDKLSVDSVQLKERLKELIKVEEEEVGPVSAKKRKDLRRLAEDELLSNQAPKSKIIECMIDNTILYVGSTSKSQIGTVLSLLKHIGIEVEYKTPWLDAGQEEEPNDVVDLKEPGQSIFGCRFLKALMNDPEIFVEPQRGNVKLITHEGAKVTLSGPVLNELDRYIDQGAEILNAKLLLNDMTFGFDGLSYRINGLKLEGYKTEHWTEALEERIDKLSEMWDNLDQKYESAMNQSRVSQESEG